MPMRNFIRNTNLKALERALKAEGKKILVYHSDGDGMCSSALLLKFFTGFKTIPREGPVIDEGFLKNLLSAEPDVIVFMDIPADQEWGKLLLLKSRLKKTKIAIIDHHIVEKDMNKEGIIHINPRMTDRGAYVPASAVMYEILNSLKYPAKKFIWISAVGVIADHGFEDCKEILKECEDAYPGTISDRENHFSLYKVADMLSALISLKGLKGAKIGLELLVNLDSMEEIRNHQGLREYYVKVKKEIDRIMEDFRKHAEFVPEKNLIMYEIKSRLNITSIIATKVTEKHKKEVIIIRKRSRQGWKVSLRCQSGKVNVGEIAKRASRGVGSGGGHQKSAGALVKDWEKFREAVLKEM